MFEFGVPVEDLDREQRPAEGRAKSGADPAGDPGQQQDAAIGAGKAQAGGEKRAEPGTDLGDRPLAPGAAAGADGRHRGQRLDPGDPAADQAAAVVKGVDGGIGAVPFRFGGEVVDQQPGDQTAQGRQQKQHPAVVHGQRGDQGHRLRTGADPFPGRIIMGNPAEHRMIEGIGGEIEGNRPAAGNQADHSTEQKVAAFGMTGQLAQHRWDGESEGHRFHPREGNDDGTAATQIHCHLKYIRTMPDENRSVNRLCVLSGQRPETPPSPPARR